MTSRRVAGEDYTALSGAAAMVTFAANAAGAALMQTVSVAITNDSVSEGNETFTLSFGSLPVGRDGGYAEQRDSDGGR